MKKSMGIIIILLMVSSVLGLVFSYSGGGNNPSEHTIRYGDHVFTRQENLYITEINGNELAFYYTPDVVLGVDMPQEFVDAYTSSDIFLLTQDVDDVSVDFISILTYDVTRSVVDKGGFVQPGFTTAVQQLPVLTCDNATSLTVYAHSGNVTSATYEDKCLDLSLATNADIALYRDALIYTYYGVI